MLPASRYTCTPEDVADASGTAPAHALRFLELGRAAMFSRVFTTAVKMDLFTQLHAMPGGDAGGAATAEALRQALGFCADPGFRATADFLDMLVALQVLQRQGDGPAALYSNTPAAAKYLSRRSPEYMGGLAIVNHDRSFPQSLFLEEALRLGRLPPAAFALVPPATDTFAGTGAGGHDATEAFALGMTGANAVAFRALASKFDWSKYKTLGDIGGSAGALSCAVAAAHPHITAVTHDLPALHSAAVAYVQQRGLADRVQVRDIDFFADDAFPSYDVITMSMILHDWGLEKKRMLLRKAFASIPPGGALVALDVVIDDQRRRNLWGLGMSLNMLLEFGLENSYDYTFEACDNMLPASRYTCTPEDVADASGTAPAHALRFLELGRAAMFSRVFTTAVKMDLFTQLHAMPGGDAGGAATAEALRQALGFCADPGFRATADFLDMLVALQVLQRQGDGPAALYSNTPAAAKYLSRRSPDYMGAGVLVSHDRLYPQYMYLEETLRLGEKPPAAAALVPSPEETFKGLGGPQGSAIMEEFSQAMTGTNLVAFRALASEFDWSKYKTLGDIGGSAGALSCAVAAAHPHITAVTLDLPPMRPVAEAYVQEQGLSGRVKARDLDFFADPTFPSHDVITMSNILHDWGLEKKRMLLRKAYVALPPGGAFIALEMMVDNERRRNVWGMVISLTMLCEFGKENSYDYTFEEFQQLAKEAGFGATQHIHLAGATSAAVAFK